MEMGARERAEEGIRMCAALAAEPAVVPTAGSSIVERRRNA
jgi:hypothetical protein